MINLLTDNEKLNIRKEYRLRIIATVLAGVCIIGSIAMVLLFPSYILTLYKSKSAEESMKNIPAVQYDQKEFTDKLITAKVTASVLKPEVGILVPSDVIAIILNTKGEDVVITSITYSKKTKDPLAVSVQGKAETRKALVDFTTKLRAQPRVASVDLPVSSFAKDTDIPFSFNIITK